LELVALLKPILNTVTIVLKTQKCLNTLRGGKVGQVNYDKEQYTYSDSAETESTKKARLDLNDLLKRAKDQQRSDKKNNLVILSAVVAVIGVVVLILNL
tara:strand:+ start:460 stop:756 length:297 start_codon:yes stop_codon:yes gene_type:complete